MSKCIDDLFENSFCALFIQPFSFLHILKKVAATGVLHNHQKMFFALKYLKQSYHATMSDFLEDVDFLKNFPTTVLIFDVCLVDGLNRNFLAC